jgi:hypothetical protein
MRIEAIFTTGSQRIVLTPESAEEKKLLGSVLSGDIEGRVNVKFEGHYSHQSAEVVYIDLRPSPHVGEAQS